jgi:hypothetical protein
MIRSIRGLCRSAEGATSVEFALSGGLFIIVMLGVGEFAMAYWQWNAAAKATHVGARLAAVSDPVAADLRQMTGLSADVAPGDPMPFFERICDGRTKTCTDGEYDPVAMSTIVYGRGNASCPADPQPLPPMCSILPRVGPENVVVTYTNSGLGFAGRPGGPVPTITLELQNIEYDFVLLDRIFGAAGTIMPSFRTTVTGEDLSSTSM